MSIDFIHTCGISEVKDGLVLPLATGMSISLCLLSLRQQRPEAQYVVWFRVDQKTCLKSILTCGLKPIIIQPRIQGDELATDIQMLRSVLETTSASSILCIIPTTSGFAPRLPDDIVGVSKLAKEFEIPVLVNNAYGLQSSVVCKAINRAIRVGRVDLLVSSTDKNMLVPVGGALVYSPSHNSIDIVRKNYPGRASMSPILDVFITLLSMGKRKLLEYLKRREECYDYLRDRLAAVAEQYGQRILDTPNNPISLAVTLDKPIEMEYENAEHKDEEARKHEFQYTDADITRFGAMLYTRGVSGARCVGHHNKKSIGEYTFENYGGHCDNYPHAYFTAAAAIGISKEDVDTFIERIQKNWKQYLKDLKKKSS